VIQQNIPWPVWAAVMMAAPGSKNHVLVPVDDDSYFAVTLHEDQVLKLWLLTREDEKTWGVAEIQR
jgi:hypothetical protein